MNWNIQIWNILNILFFIIPNGHTVPCVAINVKYKRIMNQCNNLPNVYTIGLQ